MSKSAKTKNKRELNPIKFKPVPKLLDHIGLAMYSKFNKAISELVVNGYDADATRVDVNIKYNKVSIKDNGFGMSEGDIRESYMELGGDRKRSISPKTPTFKRLPVGNKGIGKLAALGIAHRFTIVTKKKGKPCFSYTIDRNELSKKKTLEDSYIDLEIVKSNEPKNSGTIVELTNILPHVKIDKKELKGYLAREVPQGEKFQVYVDGEKCEIKDIPGNRFKIEIHNKICGKIEGEVILAKSSFSNIIKPGISTTVRGRVVGEPSLFDVNKGGHKFARANYITGRIEVTGLDPELNTDKIPVIKTDREGFNANHPKYLAYNEEVTNVLKKVLREDERDYYAQRKIAKSLKTQHVIPHVSEDIKTYSEKKSAKQKKGTAVTPIGIKNEKVKLELQRMKGLGTIKIDKRNYKLTMRPMGANDLECRIDDDIGVVNINSDHPAYIQAGKTRTMESVLFRAIADAYAYKVSKTVAEMYTNIDKLIRVHAAGIQKRHAKK